MTSKLTREEMQELISALRLTPTSTVNGISLGRLADALSEKEAAMGSEPIGFRCRRNDGLGDWFHVYHRAPDEFERKHLVIENIYTAPQPAPVVPDGSKEALSEAVAAIYFTDSTDYLPALYSVVNALSPEVFAQLLNNEKAAFDATRLPAAPQEVKGE